MNYKILIFSLILFISIVGGQQTKNNTLKVDNRQKITTSTSKKWYTVNTTINTITQPAIYYDLNELMSSNMPGSAQPIIMDGLFDDWSTIPVIYFDPNGDGITEDFGDLKIANDNDFIFFYLNFHDGEHLMQNWNETHIYLDTDNNAQTGLLIQGIGAELEWCFGCRNGVFHQGTEIDTIYQNYLTMRLAPTITSEQFELCISRTSPVMTLNGSQIPDTIKVVFRGSDVEDDYLPDESGGVVYVIDTAYVQPPDPIPLPKESPDQLRILTYNILYNGLFDQGRQPRFRRILQALQPDIMAFQEAWGNITEIMALMTSWMPQNTWYVSPEYSGNYVVSKYPILHETFLIGSERSMAVLLDTGEELLTNLLIINSHFPCCDNNEGRQRDADELISVLREWRSGSGPFPLPEGTPIIHVGDFNLVGYSQQLKTLTEGDIVDEATFGVDFFPDWDGSPMTDLFSRHTAIRMGYTWRYDNSSFSPGKLDYILYTDSVVEPEKHFVLNTTAMSAEELLENGLQSEDTNLASDHLPRVMDIAGIQTSIQDIPYNFGWNLIGLPLATASANYLVLFPDAILFTLYSFVNNVYNNEEELFPGSGYWLRFANSGVTSISGIVINNLTISLVEGWNLISGISINVDVPAIIDPGGIIVPGTIYGYNNNGYNNVETIEPGFGYWVRSSGEGEIMLSSALTTSKKAPFVSRLTNANSISFNGNTLYFGVTVPEQEKLSYSLPPKPPVSAFACPDSERRECVGDVRFTGDWKYCTDSGNIEVMNNSESLTIAYNIVSEVGDQVRWVLTSNTGNEYELSGSGTIVVDGNITEFALNKIPVVPKTYSISQNYPNPFNPVTSINYELPKESFVTITVYNIRGQKINNLVSDIRPAGHHQVKWDGTNFNGDSVSSGVYIFIIDAGSFKAFKKMVLMK